jgi:hypothetical protein
VNRPDKALTKRELGAWGITGPCHAGKGNIPDVLAAVAHTLCDIQNRSVTYADDCVNVNLQTAHTDGRCVVSVERDRIAMCVIRPTNSIDIRLRLPSWVAKPVFQAGDTRFEPRVANGYWRIPH